MGNVHGCMGVPAVRIQISLGVLVLDLGTLFDIMLINMQLLSKAADNTSLASLQMYSEKDGKGEERDEVEGRSEIPGFGDEGDVGIALEGVEDVHV